jgi:hypothetical protein
MRPLTNTWEEEKPEDDMLSRDPHKMVDFIFLNREKLAEAVGARGYLENFLKSKKALLMKASGESTIGAQEREAYAHPDYIALFKAIEEDKVLEETLRWGMTGAQMRVEIWRTEQANFRAEGKIVL